MMRQVWSRVCSDFIIRRIGLLPGFMAIFFVVLLRLGGSLQFLEWAAFDTFMRLRPKEAIDKRVLIVGINEADIRRIKKYPIPDKELALLLKKLYTYQPGVIGLDIFRDLPQEPGHKEFVQVLKETKNLIAVEKALPDISGATVSQPPIVSPEQIGFSDALIDRDGKQRRSLLGSSNINNQWRFSFPLQLARVYLNTKKIFLENVDDDVYGMRFAGVKLPRFLSNHGSYIHADAGGSQILINFRNRNTPFDIVSLSDVLAGRVEANRIRDKIVLIGMTSPSVKDYAISSAINSRNSALIYGVEIQAHVVSQIVSAVLDKRKMLNSWADSWEYLWIVAWGIIGIGLGRFIRSPWKIIIYVTIANLFLLAACYGLLLLGWWIPFVPAFMLLALNYSAALVAFYKYDEALQLRIQDRQLVIDQAFDAIHSQPLQKLSMMLRKAQSEPGLISEEFLAELQQLNQEMRDIYELVRKEAVTELNSFYLRREERLDLQQPLHDILEEVYNDVLERDYPYFKTIKLKVVKFEPMNEDNLSIEQKRRLCRFLEEVLRNIGKYAQGTTRIDVICTQEQGQNVIRVADDGLLIDAMANLSLNSGFGSKQAENLAKQLINGKFQLLPNSPKGLVCELTWSSRKFWFW